RSCDASASRHPSPPRWRRYRRRSTAIPPIGSSLPQHACSAPRSPLRTKESSAPNSSRRGNCDLRRLREAPSNGEQVARLGEALQRSQTLVLKLELAHELIGNGFGDEDLAGGRLACDTRGQVD